MIDSFAQVLSLGEPRVALDSSQTFNNPAGIEFRAPVARAQESAGRRSPTERRRRAASSDSDYQEAGMAPKPRRAPQDVPDSLPKRDEGTDVMPDDVRRNDRSQRVPPDSLPPMDEQSIDRAEDLRGKR
jgi:hypothetical protein